MHGAPEGVNRDGVTEIDGALEHGEPEGAAGSASLGDPVLRADRLGRWDWTVETGTLRWSGPIYRIFGVAPADFGGDTDAFFERVHPDDRERVREEVRLALEEGEPYSVYHRIVRPDGQERVVHEQAEVTFDDDGRPVHMHGTVEDITEWRQTRSALKLRDEAIRICLTPIFVVDANLRFTFLNQAFVDLVGARDESALLGKQSLHYAAEPDAVRRLLRTVDSTGRWSGEAKLLRVDGRQVSVQVSAIRVPSVDTRDAVVVSILDLTDLRTTERELRRKESELAEILSRIDSVVYRDWYRDGEAPAGPGFLSSPIERLAGRSAAELLAEPESWFDLVHPDDRRPLLETLRRARVDGEPVHVEYRIRELVSGQKRWVEESIRPDPDHDGLPRGLFGTLRDITEQKAGEQDLARLRERVEGVAREWRQTFDAIEVPIFLLHWNGTVRRLNQAAAALVEGGFGGALGRPLGRLGGGEPWRSAAQLVDRVHATGQSQFREVRDSQTRVTWHLTISAARPAGGRGARWMVAVFRDVTAVFRLQETLRRTEKMSAMGALVARVAHEVRNPLFGISATVDALTAEFGGDEHLAEYLDVLRGEVGRMSRVMEDLLGYGRTVSLEVSRTSVEEVVAAALAACRSVAESAGVLLCCELPDDLPAIDCDRSRLEQVFQNLIENAVQHGGAGTRVVLRGGADGPGGAVTVRVEDRGPGLMGEDPESLVEPFYSKRQGGTGLGLWIVQRILVEHGGVLRLRDRDGGGTVAEVLLPRASSGTAELRE